MGATKTEEIKTMKDVLYFSNEEFQKYQHKRLTKVYGAKHIKVEEGFDSKEQAYLLIVELRLTLKEHYFELLEKDGYEFNSLEYVSNLLIKELHLADKK